MKISELIKTLKDIEKDFGDIDIRHYDSYAETLGLTEKDVFPDLQIYYEERAETFVIFGK